MKLLTNKMLLNKYSRDKSVYQIKPSFVTFPKSEEEVIEIAHFARHHKIPLHPRGGGSGLSGSALGKGIVIAFSRNLNKIIKIAPTTVVQSGCLLSKFRPKVQKAGYMLASSPLHNDCAVGGNVSTDSVGPRSIKYGTFGSLLTSLRGVLVDGRVIDTAKKIPNDLEDKLLALQKEIRKDKKTLSHIKSRPYVAGGYNLKAFLHKDIKNIITDLVTSSVGTLILLTELRLKLPRFKSITKLYIAYFNDYDSLQKVLNRALKSGAVTIEYLGKDSMDVWNKRYQYSGAVAALILGFEEKVDLNLKGALKVTDLPENKRKHFWKARALILPNLERRAKKLHLQIPSGIDDTTFNPKDFSKIIKDVNSYAEKNKIIIASFGHIGVGSLHLRAFIDMKLWQLFARRLQLQ